ncbi:unnamed protein product [Leuciscus chuanchicus]
MAESLFGGWSRRTIVFPHTLCGDYMESCGIVTGRLECLLLDMDFSAQRRREREEKQALSASGCTAARQGETCEKKGHVMNLMRKRSGITSQTQECGCINEILVEECGECDLSPAPPPPPPRTGAAHLHHVCRSVWTEGIQTITPSMKVTVGTPADRGGQTGLLSRAQGGREGEREICLLAQLSHQTDLPQSVLPLLCPSTRLSLSGKRQPIGKPLTLRVTAIAMVTVGVWWGENSGHCDRHRSTATQRQRLKVTGIMWHKNRTEMFQRKHLWGKTHT